MWFPSNIDTSWQSLAIAKQLAEAYNERAKCCFLQTIESQLGITDFDNDKVSVYKFISKMQAGILAMRQYFVNPASTILGQRTFLVPYANAAALYTAAGIPNGFYRMPFTGGSANGVIQDGDKAGWWLFDDLQKCLTVMKRRVHSKLPLYRYIATKVIDSPAELDPAEAISYTQSSNANARIAITNNTYHQVYSTAYHRGYILSGLTDQFKKVTATFLVIGYNGGSDLGTGYTWYSYPPPHQYDSAALTNLVKEIASTAEESIDLGDVGFPMRTTWGQLSSYITIGDGNGELVELADEHVQFVLDYIWDN